MHRPLLSGWLAGLFTAAIVAAAIGGLMLFGVVFDTSASKPHSRIASWAIHETMIHSVRRRAGGQEDRQAAHRASSLSGAIEYEKYCIACHGGPATKRAPWASAMMPTPPFLIDASRRWSHAELYRLVHDGVKMSGMPAWGEVEPPQKISDIVAFLEWMPKLTPSQFIQLQAQVRKQFDAAAVADAASKPAGERERMAIARSDSRGS